MNTINNPRPTRSTLTNRRLNRAIRAAQLGNPNGLRLAARRSALPKARRGELALAVTGSLIILSLAAALSVVL